MEEELITRARDGEGAAWNQILKDHREGVFRYAYLQLQDAQEAEDVAQETFLRAFQSLDRFDPDRPMRPWLLTIAANLARNRRRSLGRYWEALRRFLQSRPARVGVEQVPGRDPVEWEALRIWEVVRGLGELDREILYLRYFLELPVEEAAQVLEVAKGTVKSRTYRALGRLKEAIAREAPDLWRGESNA